MSRATGTVPERVQSRVHTTEPTGPVPEPFHSDHIARWSARSGTTGCSGTGVNTGARLRSGTVPVPKLWCEHGLVSWTMWKVAMCTDCSDVSGLSIRQVRVSNFQWESIMGGGGLQFNLYY